MGRAPRRRVTAICRLCPTQRKHRHQRHRAQQRQRLAPHPLHPLSPQNQSTGRHISPLRHKSIPVGQLRLTHGPRLAPHSRPSRPGRTEVVEAKSRRNLQSHPRLRRFSRQSQLRRPARPDGFRPHSCRGSQYARPCPATSSRHSDVEGICLLTHRRRPRHHRIDSATITTDGDYVAESMRWWRSRASMASLRVRQAAA